MMDDGKNKGSGEFDDDAFGDDFSDTDFDEAAFDEEASYDDLPEDEADYEGDDFEVEDWGDAEEGHDGGKNKKSKKQKTGGGGLSFNAMVITGAVLLGGAVLVFNVMKETSKAESAQSSIFRSILNIGGIMDGTLFGEQEQETVAATDAVPENTGFLNDPSQPIPTADQNANPPQPSPIAPADGTVAVNEPLTPMPEMPITPSAEAPRGPDDIPPVVDVTQATDVAPSPEDVAAVPAPEASASPETPQSAEDILKQAMASREQKQQEEQVAEPVADAVQEKVADAKEKIEEAASEVKEEVKEAVAPVAEKVEEKIEEAKAIETPPPAPPVTAVVPEETKQEITANKEAVSAVESKLDTLLKRMDQIESDLGTIRENKQPSNTEALEQTIASLREEIAQIKARPAVPAPAPRENVSNANDTSDAGAAPAPKPAKKKKAAAKPRTQQDEAYSPNRNASSGVTAPAVSSSASAGAWELRAAQPGRAWVSKAGTRDMQAVAVGDNLPGIGRINAITYMNGRWTVTGTQGSIQQ